MPRQAALEERREQEPDLVRRHRALVEAAARHEIDLGDDVVVLVRDFGRRAEDTAEVAVTSAAVWTLRDGKIARITYWADRRAALKALGLES